MQEREESDINNKEATRIALEQLKNCSTVEVTSDYTMVEGREGGVLLWIGRETVHIIIDYFMDSYYLLFICILYNIIILYIALYIIFIDWPWTGNNSFERWQRWT